MSGLGKQDSYRKVRERIDAGAPPPIESRRRRDPTPEELADPLLSECRRLHLAFRASKPRDWQLLRERNAALSKAEAAGHSLRAIGRVTGMTHVGVRNIIESERYRDDPWESF